jgi:hypothetical protein
MWSVAPLAVLGIGVMGLGLCLARRLPFAGQVTALTIAGAWAAHLALLFVLPIEWPLSVWVGPLTPGAASTRTLLFRLDPAAWWLGFVHLSVVFAASLTGFARKGGQRLRIRTAALLLAFVGLPVFAANNLVTLVLAWVGLDLVVLAVLLLIARGEGLAMQATRAVTVNALSTLCLVLAAFDLATVAASSTLSAAADRPLAALLLTVAMVLRIGLFSLSSLVPGDAVSRPGLSVVLRIVPALVTFGLAYRLAELGFPAQTGPWLTLLAGMVALVGAVRVWSSVELRQSLASLVIVQGGVVVGAVVAQAPFAVLACAVTLGLGGAAVYLSNGYDPARRWLSLPAVVGAAAFGALPGTSGFSAWHPIVAGLVNVPVWGWLALASLWVAQVLVMAGLARMLVWPGEPLEGGTVVLPAYLSGLGFPVLGVLLSGLAGPWAAGFVSGRLTTGLGLGDPTLFLALGLIVLAMPSAYLLWRSEEWVRVYLDPALSLLPVGWVSWLWRPIRGLGFGLAAGLEGGSRILEGDGAILLALAVMLALSVVFR